MLLYRLALQTAVAVLFGFSVGVPTPLLGQTGEELLADLERQRDGLRAALEDTDMRLSDREAIERLALQGFDAEDSAYLRDQVGLPWYQYYWRASFARDQVKSANRTCPSAGMVVAEAHPEFASPRGYFYRNYNNLNQSLGLLVEQYVDPTPTEIAPLQPGFVPFRARLEQVEELLLKCHVAGWRNVFARQRLDSSFALRAYKEVNREAEAARLALDHEAFSRAQRAGTRYFSEYQAARKEADKTICELNRDCLGPMIALLTGSLFPQIAPLPRCERDRRLMLRRVDGLLEQFAGQRAVPLATVDAILELLDDLGRDLIGDGSLASATRSNTRVLGFLSEAAASQSVGRAVNLGIADASAAALFGAALSSGELALLSYGIVGPLVSLYAKGVKEIVVNIAQWPQIDENTEAYQWLVDGVEFGGPRRVDPLIRQFLRRHPAILERATGEKPPIGGSDARVARYLTAHADNLFLALGYLEEKHGGFPRHKWTTDGTKRYDVGYYRTALRDELEKIVQDIRRDVAALRCP